MCGENLYKHVIVITLEQILPNVMLRESDTLVVIRNEGPYDEGN